MDNRLYKVSEVAQFLQVKPQTIYKLIKQGKLEHYRIGNSIRLPMPKPEAIKDE